MVPPFAWETPGCPTTKHLRAVLPAGAMPTGQSLGHRFPFCVPWVIRPFILQPGKGLLSFVCLNPQGWGVKGLDGTQSVKRLVWNVFSSPNCFFSSPYFQWGIGLCSYGPEVAGSGPQCVLEDRGGERQPASLSRFCFLSLNFKKT